MTKFLPACIIKYVGYDVPKLVAALYWDGYTAEMLEAKLIRYVKTHYNKDAKWLSLRYIFIDDGEVYNVEGPDMDLFILRSMFASRVYGYFYVEGVMRMIEIECVGCGTVECDVYSDMYDVGGGDLLAGANIMSLNELEALVPPEIPTVDEDGSVNSFLRAMDQANEWLDNFDKHLECE